MQNAIAIQLIETKYRNLIANTTTQQGLIIQAELDTGTYPTGIKISDKELAVVNLIQDDFHGD